MSDSEEDYDYHYSDYEDESDDGEGMSTDGDGSADEGKVAAPAAKRTRRSDDAFDLDPSAARPDIQLDAASIQQDSPFPALPGVLLEKIFSYVAPDEECRRWEWLGSTIGRTCRGFRSVALAPALAPARLSLDDFREYRTAGRGYFRSRVIDARVGMLKSLVDFKWKRQHLKEFRVSWQSSTRNNILDDMKVLDSLRALLTEPDSFPELERLDVELGFANSFHGLNAFQSSGLVDAESLRSLPSAMPALKNLSLNRCFRGGTSGISPRELTQFFRDLRTPLISLSVLGAWWMTDDHVESFLPVVGESLTHLELDDVHLSDRSLAAVAACCPKLQSLTIPTPCVSSTTEAGLWSMLSAMNIAELQLSIAMRQGSSCFKVKCPTQEGFQAIVDIGRHLKSRAGYVVH